MGVVVQLLSLVALVHTVRSEQECVPSKEEKFYSQEGQDKFCYNSFFKDKPFGTFAEIGAYDGTFLSNLRFFEDSMCWRGVCVEPITKRFDTLKTSRKCAAYNGAICPTSGKKEFWHVNAVGTAAGFDTWSGFPETMGDFHKNRINDLVKKGQATVDKKEMQCYALADLMKENNLDHLDLVSLDVENFELPILQSWDLRALNISVLVVEDSNTDEITKLMTTNGYDKVTKIDADFIFKKQPALNLLQAHVQEKPNFNVFVRKP